MPRNAALAAKATTRVSYLVEAIKAIDERISKAEVAYANTQAAALTLKNERIAKLEPLMSGKFSGIADATNEQRYLAMRRMLR